MSNKTQKKFNAIMNALEKGKRNTSKSKKKNRTKQRKDPAQQVLQALDTKRKSDSQYCAFQQLHTDTAIKHGRFVGAPTEEINATFKFGTRTNLTLNAYNNSTASQQVAALLVTTSGVEHLIHTTAFDAVGRGTASTASACYGQSTWASKFDKVRMVACTIVVHQEIKAEDEAGSMVAGNYSPQAGALSALGPSELRNLPSVSASAVKTDEWKMNWMPVRQDEDFKWVSPTVGTNPDSNGVVLIYSAPPSSASMSAAQFDVQVFTVWEALVKPGQTDFYPTTKEDISQDVYDAYVQASLMELPMYSLGRHVGPDGFWGDAWGYAKKIFKGTPVGALASSGEKLYGAGKSFINSPGLDSFVDVLTSGANFTGAVGGVVSDTETVLCSLSSFTPEQIKIACSILSQTDANLAIIRSRAASAVNKRLHPGISVIEDDYKML